MGCPTSYDGMNAAWTRGKLSRLSSGTLASGTKSYTYAYNAFGQRISRNYSFLEGTSGITSVQAGDVTAYSKKYYYDHFGRLIAEATTKTLYPSDTSSERIVFLYDESGMVGMEYTVGTTSTLYYFRRNLQGDVVAIYDTSGNVVAKYLYDAWGNCTISSETTNHTVANANPIRYRGYYYDDDTGLYYCNARYYSPKWRRFISPDDTAYLDPESVNGLNLYCYCHNDPVNYCDPSGHAPWWSWALSGLQLVAGVAMCFIPGMQGLGVSMAVGGAVGLVMNAVEPQLAQMIGAVGSVANGYGAINAGCSLIGLGGWASVAGIGLALIGVGTIAFGANEMVAALSGTNYIQSWTGMSDAAYSWTYLGLNVASSVGQSVGNMYRLHTTKQIKFNRDGTPRQYRYFHENGQKFFDLDFNHGNINYKHWHGWNSPTSRTKGDHWESYLRLVKWMFWG